MPSMTLMMAEIWCDESLMPRMVETTWPTTSPPRSATWVACMASWLAVRADSAFWRTVAPSCSMDEAVCSSAAACCSVRAERSWLPSAISWLAMATPSEPLRTRATMPERLPCINPSWAIMLSLSLARIWMGVRKSPAATLCANAVASAGSAPSARSWRRTIAPMTKNSAIWTAI